VGLLYFAIGESRLNKNIALLFIFIKFCPSFVMQQKNPKKENFNKDASLILLISNEQIRQYLLSLLKEYNYSPLAVANPSEALLALRTKLRATVFIDCDAVNTYGVGICSKLKVACQHCRVVLLCDKRLPVHRQIIKDAMEIGIFACLLPPYEDWEVLIMASFN
jgi:response regulator RpfG family c-di-GMP phosphodiesterase